LATCNFKLPLNQILLCNHFSNRMLNLESCIHLHEKEFICFCVKDEFNGTCIIVTNSSSSLYCSLTNFFSHLRSNSRWSFLNNFLMSSLYRTVSLIEINIVTILISKHLYFNMSWFLNIFFNNHMIITEILNSFSFSCF
jgi:hypothetical protein